MLHTVIAMVLHLELIKTHRTGHTSERFFSFIKSFEVGRFNSNLDLWGRKSHFYNPDIFKWDDPPLICISSGAGSQYKECGRRKLVFPCLLVLASKYITSLALQPISLEFCHILKTNWDIQPHGLLILGLSIGSQSCWNSYTTDCKPF